MPVAGRLSTESVLKQQQLFASNIWICVEIKCKCFRTLFLFLFSLLPCFNYTSFHIFLNFLCLVSIISLYCTKCHHLDNLLPFWATATTKIQMDIARAEPTIYFLSFVLEIRWQIQIYASTNTNKLIRQRWAAVKCSIFFFSLIILLSGAYQFHSFRYTARMSC